MFKTVLLSTLATTVFVSPLIHAGIRDYVRSLYGDKLKIIYDKEKKTFRIRNYVDYPFKVKYSFNCSTSEMDEKTGKFTQERYQGVDHYGKVYPITPFTVAIPPPPISDTNTRVVTQYVSLKGHFDFPLIGKHFPLEFIICGDVTDAKLVVC